jgi:HrpA-like RNA helicase
MSLTLEQQPTRSAALVAVDGRTYPLEVRFRIRTDSMLGKSRGGWE